MVLFHCHNFSGRHNTIRGNFFRQSKFIFAYMAIAKSIKLSILDQFVNIKFLHCLPSRSCESQVNDLNLCSLYGWVIFCVYVYFSTRATNCEWSKSNDHKSAAEIKLIVLTWKFYSLYIASGFCDLSMPMTILDITNGNKIKLIKVYL